MNGISEAKPAGRFADSHIELTVFPGFAEKRSPRALCRRPLRGLGQECRQLGQLHATLRPGATY